MSNVACVKFKPHTKSECAVHNLGHVGQRVGACTSAPEDVPGFANPRFDIQHLNMKEAVILTGFVTQVLTRKDCLQGRENTFWGPVSKVIDRLMQRCLSSVLDVISPDVWERIWIQGKADILRIFLLHKLGGVWADAKLCMTQPLDSWLNMEVDFRALIRRDR